MGKSRLVAEFVRNVRRDGQLVAFGECQAYGTRTPYFVWREIWRRLFGLDDDDTRERQIALLESRLAAIDPGLVARTPLLSEVVGLSIPDSSVTRTFDARLRKSSLEDLLATCLKARATEAPFVTVLEDCHWIDELSRDLLEVLTRAATSLPILFVLAYRPATEPGGDLGVERPSRVLGARPGPHGTRRGRGAGPLEDAAAGRQGRRGLGLPRRARGLPVGRQPVLRGGAAQLRRRLGHRRRRP